MIVVGVTGAINSGKTTLVNALAKRLREKEIKVTVVQEVAQSVFREKSLRPGEVYHLQDIAEIEGEILSRQLATEETAKKMGADVVLVDRTLYDWLYFALRFAARWAHSDERVLRSLQVYADSVRHSRYDLILFCRPVFHPAIRDEQELQDKAIEAIIASVNVMKVYLTGSVEERVEKAEQAIMAKLEVR